jgi:hypothetical protein
MKKFALNKIVIMTVALLSVVIACKDSFLDVKPTGAIAADQLKTKKGFWIRYQNGTSMELGLGKY